MNYKETIEYLYSRMPMFQVVGSSAYKEGLEGMRRLDEVAGHPHRKFRCVHVAGTNGKGSVSHSVASVLQEAGYKVGLFTSPHLKDFRERVRVNGEMMSEEFVIDFVARFRKAFEVIYPSFFEACVAMAFDYFAKCNVDVAVVEVGLGGRLDSTNIISPDLCVITNISFDHTGILGDTLEKIAAEKAGIMKKNVPVVIGEAGDGGVRTVFEQTAANVGCPIHFVEDEMKEVKAEPRADGETALLHFCVDGFEFETDLTGDYQHRNMPTALLAIRQLQKQGYKITDEAIRSGLRHVTGNTHLLGRWQKIGENPLTICDTGHNEAGIRYVTRQIAATPHRKLRFVYGVMKDKDVAHILPLLPRVDVEYYFTQASTPRAMPCGALKEKANGAGLPGKAYGSVAEALRAARAESEEGDLVFVGGSTYVVAEVI